MIYLLDTFSSLYLNTYAANEAELEQLAIQAWLALDRVVVDKARVDFNQGVVFPVHSPTGSLPKPTPFFSAERVRI
jgi:hypothetical protein